MKAWIVNEYKEKENLVLENVPRTDLGKHDVRIKIKATGINNKDIYIRKGMYFRSIPPPLILGSDIAGKVIETGAEVKQVNMNDRIVVAPIIGCETCTYCINGEENNCESYESILGGFSEEIVVNEKNVIQIPESFSFEQAAALPIAYLTAWTMLMNKAQVKKSDTVLFWGGSSGVGTAGILLFNNFENTIAVAGNELKIEKLKNLGIDKVINYKVENVFDKVLEFTNEQGVDVIFDPVGKAAWDRNLELLKYNGIHVNCARNTGSDVEVNLTLLFGKQLQILGAKSGSKKDLQNIFNYMDDQSISPIIDRVFPFEKAEKALQYFELGNHFGKVILKNY